MFNINSAENNEYLKRVKSIQEFSEKNPEGDLEIQIDNSPNLHADNHPGDTDVPEDPYARD